MKKTITIVSLILMIACLQAFRGSNDQFQQEEWKAPAWADTLKNPLALDTEAWERGREQFDIYCWTCHGMEGKGDGAAAIGFEKKPANFSSDIVQQQTDGAIFWKLAKGRGNMMGFENLFSEEVRWEIVNYVRYLGKQD